VGFEDLEPLTNFPVNNTIIYYFWELIVGIINEREFAIP